MDTDAVFKVVVLITLACLVLSVLLSIFTPDNDLIDKTWNAFWAGFGFLIGHLKAGQRRKSRTP